MSLPLLIDLHSTHLSGLERELLQRPGVAGICLFARNLRGVDQGRELVSEVLQAAQRPLIIAIDQEGGGVVRLADVPVAPSAMALGAAGDVELSERLGFVTGRGVRRIGVNVDFAPVADVQSNPANPIIGDRAFGADPQAVAAHVAAFTRGLQRSGVAATLKHFPGHGDVAVDSHLALPRLDASVERLAALELPPFAAGIAAGAAAVMSAHLLVPALDSDRPATLSPSLLEGLLRQQLGFERVIFSDALDMRAIADGWGDAEAALQAFHAGVDVPIICNVGAGAYQRLLDALERAGRDGSIDPARARRAAAAESGSGASDRAAPVSNLVAALRAARFATVWVEELADLAAQLPGSAALLVASRERRPLTPTAIDTYRRAFALAQAQRIPAVHVALWNPMHCAQLPGPAVVTFGFRPASAAAAVAVLLGGVAEGRAPIPLSPGWGGA